MGFARLGYYLKMSKRSYAKLPCKGCITLAICKGKQEYIECSLLYTYMRTGINYHGIICSKKRYRIRKIKEMFNRKLHAYGFVNTHKRHPDMALWWEC